MAGTGGAATAPGKRGAPPAAARSGLLHISLLSVLKLSVQARHVCLTTDHRGARLGGALRKLPALALLVFSAALLYGQIQPPPSKIPGAPGGPPVTALRTRLRDGRHLAYLESGVPKEAAKYKIIFVHGFDCCRYDVLNVSQGLLEELGIYLLSFDRPGYAESDAHPARTEKSIALDVAELADNLQVGPRFHLIGFSMGGEIMWSCLKYIPTPQARRRGDPRPGRQLLVVRLPAGRGRGGLARAVPAGPARGLGRPPPAMADALVEHAEPVPELQRQEQELRHPIQGGRAPVQKIQPPNLQGSGPAAGGARLPAPRHDGRVRQVELEPPGDGGPVRRRRRRRGSEGAPVARRRGPLRAGPAVAVHQREAPLGHLPRAPDGRPPVPGRRRDARRDRQVAAARTGVIGISDAVARSLFLPPSMI